VSQNVENGDDAPRLSEGLALLVRIGRLHPGPLGVAIACGMLFGIFLVVVTALLGRLTDDLILPAFDGGVDRTDVWLGAAVFVGASVIRTLAAVGRRWFGQMATRSIARTQRTRLADRYLRVPLAYHRSRSTGELLAHADTDIEVSTMLTNTVPMSMGTLTLVVVAAVQIAVIDPMLLVVALTVFPALALANRFYTARIHEPAALVQQRIGEVSSMAHESFDGALVVKALGRERAEVEKMRTRSEDLRQVRLDVGRLRAIFEPGIEAIPNLGIVLLLAVGAWRISTGDMSEGDLVAVAALFSVLAFPVRVLGFLLEELPRAQVADARLQNVLDVADGPPAPPPPGLTLPEGPLALEFDRVSFRYPVRPGDETGGDAGSAVLDDVSFRVEPGEVVALVGATGSGKSTVAHLALRLGDVGSGAVRIGGCDVREVAPDAMRNAVALVFQESFLFADTVESNISLTASTSHQRSDEAAPIEGFSGGPYDRDDTLDDHQSEEDTEAVDPERLVRASDIARCHKFITELPEGYNTVLGERGVTLSGGQRQRVALARALYLSPRLVILDDATSAVDAVIEAEILAGLRNDQGATMLIVAHRLSTIELADRVVFLVDGRVHRVGTHTDLLRDPEYSALATAYADEPIGGE
jgi:ABC-type multidrug transport system fused ATPase/permease subunit